MRAIYAGPRSPLAIVPGQRANVLEVEVKLCSLVLGLSWTNFNAGGTAGAQKKRPTIFL